MLSVYPAYFSCSFTEEGGYSVTFPDLSDLSTCGDTLEHALEKAMDCLAEYLYTARILSKTVPAPSKMSDIKPSEQQNAFINLIAVNIDDYAGKKLLHWQWIQNACGIKMPCDIARQIENILVRISDCPVTEIDISEKAREKWLPEFRTTKNLGAVSTVSYLFYPKGVDSYSAAKIMNIMDGYGVDLQKMLCSKLNTEQPYAEFMMRCIVPSGTDSNRS